MPARRIQRSSPLPLYVQLADLLRAEIEDGTYGPGDGLPSEGDLCAAHDVSRTAVRQALAQLVDEGLVHKERGRGTFVRQRPATGLVIQEVRGLAEEMALHGQPVRTRVTHLAREVLPPDAAVLLHEPMGSEGIRLDRTRIVDGEPLARTRTWLPSPRFDDLLDADLDDASLYDHLATTHGVRPVAGYRKLEAEAASRAVARDLGLRPGAPVLKMTATNEDEDRIPFEWFVAWYRPDRVAFEMLVASAEAQQAAAVAIDMEAARSGTSAADTRGGAG